MNKLSQHDKVLSILIRRGDWVEAPDTMQYEDIFIGYKAPTRAAELALSYPEMIEKKLVEGKKYQQYRFRFENSINFMGNKYLSYNLEKFVEHELRFAGKSWEIIREKFVPDPIERVAKLVRIKEIIQ